MVNNWLAWVPGGGSLSGVKRGRDAVIAYFGELLTRSCGTLQITLHDVVAGEEHTVGLHHDSAERNGEALDQNVVLVVHLRDGQFAEIWEFHEKQADYDAFWS